MHHILCSEAWSLCRHSEIERYGEKCAATMIRHLKVFKANNKGKLPVLPDMIAQYFQEAGATPLMVGGLPLAQRRQICDSCTSVIRQHMRLLSGAQPGLVQPQRVQGITVGLLYLLRTGVYFKGICVLPKIVHLSAVLPSEGNLFEYFAVKPKCITDIENLIKKLLRTKPLSMLGGT